MPIDIVLTFHRKVPHKTFKIEVGQSPLKRFTVNTDVLTHRSRFLAATRKPEWLAGNDSSKPVDLSDEDPDVFQFYLDCVCLGAKSLQKFTTEFERQMSSYGPIVDVFFTKTEPDESSITRIFGEVGPIKSVRVGSRGAFKGYSYRVEFASAESAAGALARFRVHTYNGHRLQAYISPASKMKVEAAKIKLSAEGCEALINLYLLADKLQDLTTANMVIDELMRFVSITGRIPTHAATRFTYNSTASSNLLRMLLRDYWIYCSPADVLENLEADTFPQDLVRDIAKELMRFKLGNLTSEKCRRDMCSDKCRYHQHDNEHPRCGTQRVVACVRWPTAKST